MRSSATTTTSGKNSYPAKRRTRARAYVPLNRATAETLASMSILYKEMVAEREEIMRHKWFMSEKAGHDVGFNAAAYDWISNHRTAWRKAWRSSQKTGL